MKSRFFSLFGKICRAAEEAKNALSDRQLLERFTRLHDEDAFEVLLHRYGPMVMGVCRGMLADGHHAEDAFQATFLTLASRSDSIRQGQALASWLHRVAVRVAQDLQRSVRRERARQVRGARALAIPPDEIARDDLEAAVNEELGRLPDRYRQAIVLCCLLGKTCDEAAAELGVTHNAVWERISRGRDMLRRRLSRRGLAVASGVLLAAPALGGVSAACCESLARLAVAASNGQVAGISTRVLDLVRTSAPSSIKLKVWLPLVLVTVLAGAAAGFATLNNDELAPLPAPTSDQVRREFGNPSGLPKQTQSAPVAVLEGIIHDAAGQPVPFARVIALAKLRERGESGAGDRAIAEVQADIHGRYTLPVPPFPTPQLEGRRVKLLATAPNGKAVAVQEVAIPPGRTPSAIDLALTVARDLKGVVTDVRGEPIVGAKVSVIGLGSVAVSSVIGDAQEPPTANWPEPVMTDARGRFTIPAVGAVGVKIAVERDAYAYSELWVTAPGANEGTALIRLGPPRRLEGQVLAADTGDPLPHARVFVANPDGAVGRNVRADAEGRFSVNLPDKQLIGIQAHASGESPYLPIFQAINWPADPKQVKRDVKLILPRGVLARGRVVEEAGLPVMGAHVQFCPLHKGNPHYRPEVMSGGSATIVTDDDGRFAVPILPGLGTLVVSGPSSEYLPQETDLQTLISGRPGGPRMYPHAMVSLNTAPGDSAPNLTITLRRGVAIEGKLITPDGKPLADGRLLCRHVVVPRDPSRPIVIPVIDGRFRLPGCIPGRRYFALFMDAESRLGAVADLTVPAQLAEPVVVQLEPTSQTELHLITGNGDPITGVNPNLVFMLPPDVPLDDPEGNNTRFRRAEPLLASWYRGTGSNKGPLTDSGGRVLLGGLVPGMKYRVGKLTAAGWQALLEFEPKSGEPLRLPAIVVETDR